jgi:hypothetical protein
MLSTGAGKVEMLLTPGVFLRLGENSQLRMVSPGLADTELALVSGQATIEADYFSKDNHLTVTGERFPGPLEPIARRLRGPS